jgi:hypothetical protein
MSSDVAEGGAFVGSTAGEAPPMRDSSRASGRRRVRASTALAAAAVDDDVDVTTLGGDSSDDDRRSAPRRAKRRADATSSSSSAAAAAALTGDTVPLDDAPKRRRRRAAQSPTAADARAGRFLAGVLRVLEQHLDDETDDALCAAILRRAREPLAANVMPSWTGALWRPATPLRAAACDAEALVSAAPPVRDAASARRRRTCRGAARVHDGGRRLPVPRHVPVPVRHGGVPRAAARRVGGRTGCPPVALRALAVGRR